MSNFNCPSTWKHNDNEQKQDIFSLLSGSDLLSYEGWLYRGTQLPDALKLNDYAQNYLYVNNNESKALYYITVDGNAEAVSDKQFDFTAFEQELQKFAPYSFEEPDVWALSHEQFQNLITSNGGPKPKGHANPVMTAEIGFAPDDSVELNYLMRALIPFNELFGDLDVKLKRDLVAHIIATSGAQYYPDVLANLFINFINASSPVFTDLAVPIREEIAKTVFYAQQSLEVTEQMRSLYDMGFFADGDTDWPYLSKVLKQSPEPKHYVAALKGLWHPWLEDYNLFSKFLKNTELTPENSFDLLAFLADTPKEQRLTYLRLAQHILSPFTQDVSDEQLIEIFEQQLLQKFLQHVAYGQQDEAEALLKKDCDFAQKLLTANQSPFTDYSGRTFSCTAYEYAYWAMDTHMRRMLEKYMDDNTKSELLKRVQKIEELVGPKFQQKPRGLTYTDKNGNEQCSPHFDFSELKKALQDYINGYKKRTMAERDAAWLAVGQAQRDVPAHVAHEYCRPDRAFHCCPTFDEPTLPRVLTLSSIWTISFGTQFWFPLAPFVGLGFNDAAHRMWFEDGAGVSSGSMGTEIVSAGLDLKAITLLEKVRTADLKRSLDNLQPPAVASGMDIVSQRVLSKRKNMLARKQRVIRTADETQLELITEQEVTTPTKKAETVQPVTLLLPLGPDLAKQEKEFSLFVRQLSDMATSLETKYSSTVYASASRAAMRLSHKLKLAGKTFFANPDVESFNTFKASCKSIFASQEAQVLKEHRDIWYQIHPIFRGILGILAILTIIPAFIVAVTAKHGCAGTFFTTPETTSGQALSTVALEQAEIEAEIEAEMAKLSR